MCKGFGTSGSALPATAQRELWNFQRLLSHAGMSCQQSTMLAWIGMASTYHDHVVVGLLVQPGQFHLQCREDAPASGETSVNLAWIGLGPVGKRPIKSLPANTFRVSSNSQQQKLIVPKRWPPNRVRATARKGIPPGCRTLPPSSRYAFLRWWR